MALASHLPKSSWVENPPCHRHATGDLLNSVQNWWRGKFTGWNTACRDYINYFISLDGFGYKIQIFERETLILTILCCSCVSHPNSREFVTSSRIPGNCANNWVFPDRASNQICGAPKPLSHQTVTANQRRENQRGSKAGCWSISGTLIFYCGSSEMKTMSKFQAGGDLWS